MNAVLDETGVGVKDAVREYREKGIAVVRIRPGEKLTKAAGWTCRSAEPDEFRPRDNVGLICGWLSDGGQPGRFLVCVDLDSRLAVQLADEYLPQTRAAEGRPGKPRSHRFFFVTDVPDWAVSTAKQSAKAAAVAGKHPGPFKKKFLHEQNGSVVIDFIGNGGQAAVPPSKHDSGETREWHDGGSIDQAAVVPFEKLWDAVCRLGQAAGAKVPDVQKKEKKPRPAKSEPVVVDQTPGHVKGTCTWEKVPMEERVRRCGRYLRDVDPARSGHGGHDATYRAARIIVNDFAVDDRDAALGLLREYNERLGKAGEQKWTESEMGHKIESALDASPDPDYPKGCKLTGGDRDRTPPMAWDNPERLARGFQAKHTIRFVKDTAFCHDGSAYRVVTKEWLTSRIRKYVQDQAKREYHRRSGEWCEQDEKLRQELAALPTDGEGTGEVARLNGARRRDLQTQIGKAARQKPGGVPAVKRSLVADVFQAIQANAQLGDETELDRWLTPESGPAVVTVGNGLLDPVTRELHPHTPDWFSTVALPVAFEPAAPPPAKWLVFLGEIMEGDADRVAVLQEIFGACLDRAYPAKWFAALVGSGDNGKSVVLTVLRSLLGNRNCASINLGELTGNRFAVFGLFGKLANLVGDQGYLESADEGKLKTLTGGDLVTFEQKGRDPFSSVNRAKIVFACNTLPTFGDKSEATWNRLLPVPFNYTVPAGKKDPALLTLEHWADELPGILNWALDGLARLRDRRTFTRSAACDELKGQHRHDSNPARLFLEEHYRYTGNDADTFPVSALYWSYKQWCDDNGMKKPLTGPRFAKEVDAAFPGVGKSVIAKVAGEPVRVRVGLREIDRQPHIYRRPNGQEGVFWGATTRPGQLVTDGNATPSTV